MASPKFVNYGKNVQIQDSEKELIIKIDKTQNFGESKSGKSISIASTGGSVKLADGSSLGLNYYRKKE